MTIKAIETRYAGCRFRSRLEARWAVFLDHLEIPWEYEPQGFETPAGLYLPDFHLPENQTWLEVKGSTPSEHDLKRCTHVAYDLHLRNPPEKFFVLIGNLPRAPVFNQKWGPLGIPCIAWSVPPIGFYGFTGDGEPPAYWLPALRGLPEALIAARSARFEHGESG